MSKNQNTTGIFTQLVSPPHVTPTSQSSHHSPQQSQDFDPGRLTFPVLQDW